MSNEAFGLEQHEAERLSIIRYQLLTAEQQAAQPAPLNALALGGAQDACESMLALVCERERIEIPKRAAFLELFDAVARSKNADLGIGGFRAAAEAMNLARVNFKHHGNVSQASTIARHIDASRDLITRLSEAVFGQSIDSVSLLLFVRDAETRTHLETAQDHWMSGDTPGAMAELRLGFDTLVRDFEQRKTWTPGQTLFSTKPNFVPSSAFMHRLGTEIEGAYKWLESLDEWVKMLALGLDMRRFAFFQAHAPSAGYALNGAVHIHARDGVEINEDVLRRCYKFVVDTALAFAADDFDFDAWAARRATVATKAQNGFQGD